jgi:hypothetical protein
MAQWREPWRAGTFVPTGPTLVVLYFMFMDLA